MTNTDTTVPKGTIAVTHMRNGIAKVLRENWPVNHTNSATDRAAAATHVGIALDFARWFVKHNPDWEPYDWLDSCTPYPELYPLSELWEVSTDDESYAGTDQ